MKQDASTPQHVVFEDVEALADEALVRVLEAAARALADRGRFDLVLSGGSTPRRLYQRLSRLAPERLSGWHFWQGDERFVPPEHPDSNLAMVAESLLDPAGVSPESVHSVPTTAGTPEEVARLYAREIEDQLAGEPFDLVLLGMGADGHTASLFPGTSALDERDELVTVARPTTAPHVRITLTFPVLEAARQVLFLVAGDDKREKVEELFAASAEPSLYPAARACSRRGTTTWLLDRAAAPAAHS